MRGRDMSRNGSDENHGVVMVALQRGTHDRDVTRRRLEEGIEGAAGITCPHVDRGGADSMRFADHRHPDHLHITHIC